MRRDGSSDDQIAEFLAHLSDQIGQDLNAKAFNAFTEEDVEAIKNATLPEEIDYQIRTRYFDRTGKNPDQEAQEVYREFAKRFLENYNKKDNPHESSSSATGPVISSNSSNPADIFSAPGNSAQSHGPL